MGWNGPGGNDKDPWGNRDGDGPPELEDIVRGIQEKLAGILGIVKKPTNKQEPFSPDSKKSTGMAWLLVIALLVWLGSGIYIVAPAERGVVTQFGAYVQVTQPGPHWHWPFPIERVVIVNVDQLSSSRHKAQMLTQDENIVDIELTVQSRIQNPVDFLFQDKTPEKTLQDATETIVRETIGKSNLDFILTEGRSTVAARIKEGTQALLDGQYKTGLLITSVNMQPAKPPEQVKSAFDDAIKAREDKERTENKAHGYANGIVPVARGDAARVLADASAYRDKVIAEASGDVARFLAILKEYQKAPEITKERMYFDTMQTLLAVTDKVVIDVKNSNNIIYLPLERMRATTIMPDNVIPDAEEASPPAAKESQSGTAVSRDDIRVRKGRS